MLSVGYFHQVLLKEFRGYLGYLRESNHLDLLFLVVPVQADNLKLVFQFNCLSLRIDSIPQYCQVGVFRHGPGKGEIGLSYCDQIVPFMVRFRTISQESMCLGAVDADDGPGLHSICVFQVILTGACGIRS